MAKDRQVNIRLTDKTYSKLQERAEDKGMNVSEYIRYLITNELEKEKPGRKA